MKPIYIVSIIIILAVLGAGVYLWPREGKVIEKCGIENCHGLDIACGSNIPDACTEIYMLGDFCRQYTKCEIINNQCQLVKDEKLDKCKECVVDCEQKFEGREAFECEKECRNQILSNNLETMEIKVYFNKLENNNIDCYCDHAVVRTIPKTQAAGRAAIQELIKGPMEPEKASGYRACLPNQEVQINSLKIENQTAYIDFSNEINSYGGGSCASGSIIKGVTNTLKQFPIVDEVIISVEGETENILQP